MPWEIFQTAINQAVFLMAFLLLLALLHEAAVTSTAVAKCGQFLTRQPPAKRYFAVFGGSNIMSVLFNLGIISLLTPLIRKGVEKEQADVADIRERRQLTSMLRGFSWSVVWSPTAIAPLAVLELIDGISREWWSIYGLMCTAAICIIGWAEDRWRFRNVQRNCPTTSTVEIAFISTGQFLFCLVVTGLFDSSCFLFFRREFCFGLLVSCPLVMVLWLWAQNQKSDKTPATALKRAADICLTRLPENAKIMLALASSGYIGRLSAEMVPAEYLSDNLGLMAMPDYMVLICLTVVMTPFSWLGVSPIMMAVFLAAS